MNFVNVPKHVKTTGINNESDFNLVKVLNYTRRAATVGGLERPPLGMA